MDHASYIVPSFAIAVGGVLAMLGVSFARMRRAEGQADALRRVRREERR